MLSRIGFTKPAWHLIFRQYPNGPARAISSLPPIRHSSSSLPDKEAEPPERELVRPKEQWDPVPQKFLKRLRVEHHGIEPAKFNDYTTWYPIYKFPYLKYVHTVVRLKVYVTFISVATCLAKLADIIWSADATFGYASACAALTLFSMGLAGNLCRKLVVQIYTTEDLEYVRLGRFTFFARRQDIVLPRSLLVPLADSNDTHRKLVLKLETKMPEKVDLNYDNYEFYEDKFSIVLMFDGIHDEEKFEKILGKLLRRLH